MSLSPLLIPFILVTVTPCLTFATEFDTGGLSRASFPEGFIFGTATSAYQVEGMANKDGRGLSIWDAFVKIPGKIAGNGTADVTADQYNHYKEDVDIVVDINADAYRFSISWSRIFPGKLKASYRIECGPSNPNLSWDGLGAGKINWKGVAYYNRLINYLLGQGITPYVTLYHFDLPLALEKKYKGFLSQDIVKDFTDYAEFCFKTYGDRVKHWMTFNEPRAISQLGYDNGTHAPGRCSKEYGNCVEGNSGTEPYIVAHNVILSHAAAVKRYREKYLVKQNGRTGIVFDFLWFEPLTSKKEDNHAAQRARDFHLGWFLHPLVYGEYPRTIQSIVKERLPKFTNEEVTMVKGSFDFIGINQYTACYIFNPPNGSQQKTPGYQNDWNVGFAYSKNGVPIGARANSDWLYEVPWGLYNALTYIKERYHNPTVYICENGMDDAGNVTLSQGTNDLKRLNYYKTYLMALKKAYDDGANVVGYFAWSFLDNFEWSHGYTSRFGIVYVDFKDLKRYPKMSAKWLKHLFRKQGVFPYSVNLDGRLRLSTGKKLNRKVVLTPPFYI